MTETEQRPGFANIAHRGASRYAPENTMAAFDMALEQGTRFVELDVQLTADGVPVVHHDDSLARTVRAAGRPVNKRVSEVTSSDLREWDAGSWFNDAFLDEARPEYSSEHVPSLEEVFGRYGTQFGYFIEMKGSTENAAALVMSCIGLIDMYRLPGQVWLLSFDPDLLRRASSIDPRLSLIQSFDESLRSDHIVDLLRGLHYVGGITVPSVSAHGTLVRAAHEEGLGVHTYTVNDERTMAGLMRIGVDGIFTDRPDLLSGVMAEAEPLRAGVPAG